MRRRPGIGGLQTAAAARDQYRLLGENVAKLRTDLMKEQLSTFRSQLEDFARKHKNDIRKNPVFRSQFHEMCAKVGVDPLASNKGFWAELLGIGDFYYELGVQIVDICLATRPHNGGLINLEELCKILSQRRKGAREAVSEDDCLRAISKLKVLGSGFEVITVGKRKLVRSVPTELKKDHNEILELSQAVFRKSKRLNMSEYRGHKQHEIEDIGDIVDLDHISNLPDYILHQILSFMPTKEAVKTSILSTRWKNLWVSVPTIDFDDELLMAKLADGWLRPDVTSFVNFVERVLRLHDASNMEKFRLSCCVYRNAFQISSWISDAIIHNVQELDMSLFAKDPSVIPQSMFHNTSLVSLKIRMNCAIQLPSHVSFPCLKTLHMSFVRFMHDDFTEKLFSGCPALEELSLSDCRWINLKSIAISSSTLKSLSIRDLTHFVVFDDPTSGCKIKIDAANLTYFGYFGNLLNEIIFNDTMSLDKAFIKFPNPGEGVNKVACRAIDLFQQLKYVVSLTLSNHTMETLLFAACISFPVFTNLTHLMLTMEIGMNHTFRVLMHFLSFCPVLQSICFSEGFMCDMHLGENNSTWSSMPICITNCLKTVTLKNFHGYNSEICFLKRILKTACALEMMDIWWSKTKTYLRDLKKKIEVRKELEKIERKAAACVIKLS